MLNISFSLPKSFKQYFDEDDLTWVIKIKKGALFHNGREVTANDVEYSITRIFDKKMSVQKNGFYFFRRWR